MPIIESSIFGLVDAVVEALFPAHICLIFRKLLPFTVILQELRHPLSVTIDSPSMSASKQPTPSPAETEATVHSETCLQGKLSDYSCICDIQLLAVQFLIIHCF